MSPGLGPTDLIRDTWKAAVNNVDGMLTLCLGAFLLPVLGAVTLGVLVGPMTYGISRVAMKVARDEPSRVSDLFEGVRDRLWPTFQATLICVGLGSLVLAVLFLPAFAFASQFGEDSKSLLVVALWVMATFALATPGVAFFFFAQFTFHVMAAHPTLRPWLAIRASVSLVKDHVEEIAVATVVAVGMTMVSGTVVVFLGGFVASAFSAVLQAIVYDRLTGARPAAASVL